MKKLWLLLTVLASSICLAQVVSIELHNADGTVTRFIPDTPVDPRPVMAINPGDQWPLGNDRRIVFKRGKTYEVTASTYVGYSNLSLEAEAGTARDQLPIIRFVNVPPAPVWVGIIECTQQTNNLTIMNLVFDSVAPPSDVSKPRGIMPAGKDIRIIGCVGLNLSDFINMERAPERVLIKDCDCPLPKGIWGYGVWMVGSDITIDGLHMANSVRQHCIRGYGSHITIRNCNLANTKDPADPDDFEKATIRIMSGEDIALTNNDCGPGNAQVGSNVDEPGIANNVRITNLRLRNGAVLRYGGSPGGGATNVTIDGQPVTPHQWN